MPSFILKVTPDRDLYVKWSTIVENMTRSGTRAEFLEHLAAVQPDLLDDPGHCPEARLARADAYGTSALTHPPDGGWDDKSLIVDQRGILPRADLEAYVDAIVADNFNKAYALLVPFEDDVPLGPVTPWENHNV
jgi:hypothetical protein